LKGFCNSSSGFATLGSTSIGPNGSSIKLSPNKKYAVWICFYELYNDSVYDLLTLSNGGKTTGGNQRQTMQLATDRPALKIREDMNRIPYVEGLVHIPVFNTREAIRVLKYGEKNLQKASNSVNASSSRSHAIFCLKLVSIENSTIKSGSSMVQINQLVEENKLYLFFITEIILKLEIIFLRLSFCDLAGIERMSKTQAVGKTQKEASTINQSLTTLSRCIETMMQNQKNKLEYDFIEFIFKNHLHLCLIKKKELANASAV
jgi:hypothetical protein